MKKNDLIIVNNILKASAVTVLYALLALNLNTIGKELPMHILFLSVLIGGFILNLVLQKNMFNLVYFNELKKAIWNDKIKEFTPFTLKEYMMHSIAFYPISAGLAAFMFVGNLQMLAGSILFIWIINIIGQTSKYRLDLYMTAIKNVALKEESLNCKNVEDTAK